MLITRLLACLFALTVSACQSGAPGPRNIAITPRLDPSPSAAPVEARAQGPRTTPGRAYGAAAVPGQHADADGRFSEALVPQSALLDPTRTHFTKRGKYYEAKVGSGTDAFTWVVNTKPTSYLDLVSIKIGSATLEPLSGASVIGAGRAPAVESIERIGDDLVIRYADKLTQRLTAIGRSLRLEFVRDEGPRRGRAELDLGGARGIKGIDSISVFRVPYFDIASVAAVDLRRGGLRFLTAWFDSGFSNATMLLGQYPGEVGPNGEQRFAARARYLNADNGMRRPLRERIWLSFSPQLTDVLPSMDRPQLVDRETFSDLFYISFNCTPFAKATASIEALAGMGVQNLHIWMKQWQKDGFDFGYPNDVMPPRAQWGGLEGLLAVRAAAGTAGYAFALHHNWLFNSVDLPGKSMLNGFGQPLRTKAGGAYLKTSAALELIDEVETELHETFQTRGTYTDSLAASLPTLDLDASQPDWGLLRTALSDYTEVLRRLRKIHGTPVTSEGSLGGGNVTWGGLADVMPGSLFLRAQPPALDRSGKYVEIVPHFALGRLHDISVRAGIGPPTRFVMPQRPTMSRSFSSEERDLTQTLTALYGNAGYHWWYGLTRPGSCARDWWGGMSIFGELSRPGRELEAIRYVDKREREFSLSEWIEDGNGLGAGDVRLHLTWKSGDELWANVTAESWQPKGRNESIAPFGYLAHAGQVTAAILSTKAGTTQSLETPTRRYLDARGTLISALGITTDGAVGLERLPATEGGGWHVFPIPEYTLGIPSKGREQLVECTRIGLDTSLVGSGKVDLIWLDAKGLATASETRPAGGIDLSIDEFVSNGATSVRVSPVE